MTNKTLTILDVERMRNSPDGNPRYRLYTLQGQYTTKADSGHVYGFNYLGLERGDVVNVNLTKAGSIETIQQIEED